jgi:AcrR family transcriptional regulator
VDLTPLARHVSGNGNGEKKVGPGDALAAARRKFLHLQRVDMNELANDLGVGRATLYRWVGSRDALLGEVLWSLSEQGLAIARERARGNGVDWFLSIYNAFGDVIVESSAMRHFAETEPECALRVMTTQASPQQRRVIDYYRDLLVEASETKGLHLRLDPDTLAFVLVRLAESFLWTDLITGEEPDLTKAREVARIILTGAPS